VCSPDPGLRSQVLSGQRLARRYLTMMMVMIMTMMTVMIMMMTMMMILVHEVRLKFDFLLNSKINYCTFCMGGDVTVRYLCLVESAGCP